MLSVAIEPSVLPPADEFPTMGMTTLRAPKARQRLIVQQRDAGQEDGPVGRPPPSGRTASTGYSLAK